MQRNDQSCYYVQSVRDNMAVWSSLLRSASQKINKFPTLLFKKSLINNQIRCMSHDRVMAIKGSKWQWTKCKDMFHFYFMLGVIPLSLLTFFVNVFVGPATLEPIPEGYNPKPWEYYRHPITRFLIRYLLVTHQQDYEKFLHTMYLEQELNKTRHLQQKIEDLISERNDYKFFYYLPITAKYIHKARNMIETNDEYRTYSKY
ncbi:hypothetical protein M0804_000266 [Polistes exclamans]|nr:hypothetical protein M0804_000266 [Polistes exclamans]